MFMSTDDTRLTLTIARIELRSIISCKFYYIVLKANFCFKNFFIKKSRGTFFF